MINKSGLKLKEIAEMCKEHGVNIDSSYLSKLQTGKQPPASDEVNRAVAIVCKGEYEALFHAKNMEKTPEYIRRFVEKILPFFRNVAINSVPEFIKPFFEKEISQLSDYYLINNFLDLPLPVINENGKINIEDDNNKPTEIQVFRNTIKIIDDSMEPRIPMNATLELTTNEPPAIGDFVAVKLDDGSALIRRYYFFDNKIMLIPENKNYDPLITENEKVDILGKIKSITVEL